MTQALRARPTLYAGVQMRSRLEAQAARQFDQRGWKWVYEPLAYADQSGTYLPDFEILRWAPTRTFVEVKPAPFFSDIAAIRGVQERMEIILSSIDYCPVYLIIWEPELNLGWAMKRLFHNSELAWFYGSFGP